MPFSAEIPLAGPGGAYRLFVAWPAAPPPPEGYPVLYLLDGNADFGTFVDSMRAQTSRPEITGTEPGLIVGIGYPSDQPIDFERRALDYTPAVATGLLGPRPNGAPWPATGGAAAFRVFVETRVKPEIAARFAVDAGRQAIFGHSFGGLFVLDTLLETPAAFSGFIASSPSLWWGERILFGRLAGLRPATAKVLVSVGGLEQTPPETAAAELAGYGQWMRRNRMIDNAREFTASLTETGLDARFHLFEDEHHGSVVPAAASRAIRLAFRHRGKGRA